MNFEIKKAEINELSWINETYNSINFLPSTLKKEIVVIAYVDGVKVGLGRVAVVDSSSCELGGIYVKAEFRGKKIARSIVEFLVKNAQEETIYCIPFEHLSSFYESVGFRKTKITLMTPVNIKKKLGFCKNTYSEPTLLLMLHK